MQKIANIKIESQLLGNAARPNTPKHLQTKCFNTSALFSIDSVATVFSSDLHNST